MRTKNQISEAVTDALDKFTVTENDLYWLFTGNSEPFDDIIDQILSNDIYDAVGLHDIVSESELTDTEKTKLHFAINLKA